MRTYLTWSHRQRPRRGCNHQSERLAAFRAKSTTKEAERSADTPPPDCYLPNHQNTYRSSPLPSVQFAIRFLGCRLCNSDAWKPEILRLPGEGELVGGRCSLLEDRLLKVYQEGGAVRPLRTHHVAARGRETRSTGCGAADR